MMCHNFSVYPPGTNVNALSNIKWPTFRLGDDFIDAGILRIPSLYEYLIHLGGKNELY
jgi:hypothetical protein